MAKTIARLLRRAANRFDPPPPVYSCTRTYNGAHGVSTTDPVYVVWHE